MSDAVARRRRAADGMPAANIVVFGKAGVGKSTLLNAVFGENLAATGVGRPVTRHLQEHRVPGVPLRIIDTRGVEIVDDPGSVLAELTAEHARRAQLAESEWLHVVWYCVNAESTRFEDAVESGFIRSLAGLVRTIVVLTRAYDPADESVVALRRHIEAQRLPVEAVVPLLALERRIGPHVVEAHGLAALVDVTRDALPAAMRHAFLNAQIVRIGLKVDAAYARVDTVVDEMDTRYRWTAFFQGDRPDAEALLDPLLNVVAEVAACFGDTAVPEAQLARLAMAAGLEAKGGRAGLVRLIGRVLTWIPPLGPTAPIRLGGKLVTALAGAVMTNDADRKVRIQTALLVRVVGRAATRTCEDIARSTLHDHPLDSGEVSARFNAYAEDEARRADQL